MNKQTGRIRADELLAVNPLVGSRAKAKALIMAGEVSYQEQRIIKPSQMVPADAKLILKEPPKYVGRGGLKLERAINTFDVSPEGLVAVDIGASTGGFTDCLLQNGAKKVYCVDVGYGQLASSLTCDDRIVVMDRTNARNLSVESFDVRPQCATIDCSFISGFKVIEPLREILTEPGWIVWLLKPQFEAGPGKVGKGGVIRRIGVLSEAIENALAHAVEIGAKIRNATHSPVTGSDGNHEFLIHMDFKKEIGLSIPEVVEQMLRDLNLKR